LETGNQKYPDENRLNQHFVLSFELRVSNTISGQYICVILRVVHHLPTMRKPFDMAFEDKESMKIKSKII